MSERTERMEDLRVALRDACRVAIERGEETATPDELDAARALMSHRIDGPIYATSFAAITLQDCARAGCPAGDRTARMAYVLLTAAGV